MYVSFPGCQYSSFNNSRSNIDHVEKLLAKSGLDILGTPERYVMPDTLFYTNPYHLIKKGVDKRTELFIQDFKNSQIINK